jgi:hypothetical protein
MALLDDVHGQVLDATLVAGHHRDLRTRERE